MYSPAQAIATRAQAQYSAYSQRERDSASDETSEAIKAISGHRRIENRLLLISAALLLLLFVSKGFLYLRWEFKRRL
jgi:hypothetical protein